jgi:hypothetical protein
MKCIKCIRQTKTYDLGEIRRTDNEDAEQKVASGTWQFIPKSEWKTTRKPVEQPKAEAVIEIVAQPQQTIAEKQLNKKKKNK